MAQEKNILARDVIEFITTYIDSLEKLDILLLLRDAPEKNWTPAEINEIVRSSVQSVCKRLCALTSSGLLTEHKNGSFQYKPTSASLADGVDKLATAYRERRLRVIEMIFSQPSIQVQSFSNAFKIKKEDKDG